jgi:pantetheine-phosphate adenylyltransferase
MSLVAVYPGTFDPITNGHVDIVRRALALFDNVVVAVAENVRKAPLFSVEERSQMIRASVGNDPRVEIDSFTGSWSSTPSVARPGPSSAGLRAIADFEYEFQFAHMNRHLAPRRRDPVPDDQRRELLRVVVSGKRGRDHGRGHHPHRPARRGRGVQTKLKDGKQT